MKELKAHKTELLIKYLNKQITKNREIAEELKKSENTTFTAISYESRAYELDCALAYLMGLIYEDKDNSGTK